MGVAPSDGRLEALLAADAVELLPERAGRNLDDELERLGGYQRGSADGGGASQGNSSCNHLERQDRMNVAVPLQFPKVVSTKMVIRADLPLIDPLPVIFAPVDDRPEYEKLPLLIT